MMKVAVIVCPRAAGDSKLFQLGRTMTEALEKKGASPSLFSCHTDQGQKLSFFDYIIVVAEPMSAFSKDVTPVLGKFLENAGMIGGKRAATVLAGGVRKTACMASLMRKVEGEGVILKTSEFVSKPAEASAFILNLNLERNI